MKTIADLTTEALATLPVIPTSSAPPACSGWRPTLDAYEPSLQAAAAACATFVADMERGAEPYWLTLMGAYGCGKTLLARQVFEQAKRINPGNPANNPIWPPNWATSGAREHSNPRPYCLWFDEKDFARRLRGGEYDLPEELRGDFLIVYDELGFARDPSNFISEGLARLCQSRLRSWMVFATNLTVSDITDRLDGRIGSRLIRDGNKVVKIQAPDYALRPQKSPRC